MDQRIRLLPDSVANQIAAGEVVNRPASVVKELMENAVDAGSSWVTVNFRNGGKDLIQVVDNGSGMSPADARMAFEKHATSKIASVGDIYSLSTFGFRGEALASIASVAEVELTTRTESGELGYKIEVSGGKFVSQSPVASEVGSQFMVRNLFYNIPARKRFLDKSTTEARHITTEFQRVALCHPEVGFELYDNDSLILTLPATTLRQRIVGVVGKTIAPNLLEVSVETSVVKVEGFVGRPQSARQSVKDQYLFVNGRFFRSPYLNKAVVSGYEKLIPANTQPPYFIYLTIDCDRIDVNVHPQKTEIKFEDSSVVWQIINATVRETLAKSGAVPPLDFEMDSSIEIPVFREGVSYRSPQIPTNPEFNPFDKYPQKLQEQSLNRDLSDFMGQYDSYGKSVMEYIDGDQPSQGVLELDSQTHIGAAMVVNENYAVATIGGALAIVDLRRAQEAILYARYMMMVESGNSLCQQLLFPETIVLSNDDLSLLQQHGDDFSGFGFDIAYTDHNTIQVVGVPADLTASNIEESIYLLLDVVRNETNTTTEVKKNLIATTMASAGSRNAQIAANNESVTALITTLMACPNHAYTPSGLATMTIVTNDEIKKRLK